MASGEIILDGTANRLGNQTKQAWWGGDLDPSRWNKDRYESIIRSLLKDIAEKSLGQLVLDKIAATGKGVLIVPEPTRGPRAGAGPHTLADQHAAACMTGKPSGGTDTIVLFTPANVQWRGGGSHKAEVLLHELVHALRAMRGEELPRPLTTQPFSYRYGNLKEFVAITVTNIYSSQRGCYLRRSHDGARTSLLSVRRK